MDCLVRLFGVVLSHRGWSVQPHHPELFLRGFMPRHPSLQKQLQQKQGHDHKLKLPSDLSNPRLFLQSKKPHPKLTWSQSSTAQVRQDGSGDLPGGQQRSLRQMSFRGFVGSVYVRSLSLGTRFLTQGTKSSKVHYISETQTVCVGVLHRAQGFRFQSL